VARGGEAVPCLGLRDVSERGTGLLLAVPAEVGETLELTLSSHRLPGEHRVSLRVAHCAAGNGGFLVGGAFAEPLPPDAWDLVLT
jgi:hypothetical protein